MKQFISLVLIVVGAVANAQTVKVVKESIRMKNEIARGFQTELEGKPDEVAASLSRFLKAVGKSKKVEDVESISLPLINGKNYTSPFLYRVRDKSTQAVWFGIRPSDWGPDSTQLYTEIEKLLYDFSVTFYREKVQMQIDESMRALQAVERQQQRLVNQHKDYTTRLGENKNEKIQLEKSLENNKIQFEALNKKIAQNKKDQDSVALAGEQIKKVIEMQKEKQRKIN